MGFKPFSNIPRFAYYALQIIKVNKFVKKIKKNYNSSLLIK